MADEKKKPTKAPSLTEAPATQKISKEELAALIKKAEQDEASEKKTDVVKKPKK